MIRKVLPLVQMYIPPRKHILQFWILPLPKNLEGTEPYKAILGVGFPFHKPYIKLI